jgi:error-prone DNA polymerase
MGFYSPATIVADARHHGVEIRGPDLVRSDWECTLELGDGRDPKTDRTAYAIRIGLSSVDGLGADAKEKLLAGRPWKSVSDVCLRSGLTQKALGRLARAGAFDSLFGPGESKDRRDALWKVLRAVVDKPSPLLHRAPAPEPRASLRPTSPIERTSDDYRVLGLSPDSHPAIHVRPYLRSHGVLRSDALAKHPDRMRVKAGGLVVARQRPGTAKGFCFLTLEDEAGFVNVIVRPKIFDAWKRTILGNAFLVVEGELQREDGVVNLQAESFTPVGALGGAESAKSRDFR